MADIRQFAGVRENDILTALRTPLLRKHSESLLRAKLLSTDVFDTLLLRGIEGEERRFAWACSSVSDWALKTHNISISDKALLLARMEAKKVGYKTLIGWNSSSDVSHEEFITIAAALFPNVPNLVRVWIDAELTVERKCLRSNSDLVHDIKTLRSNGMRVIAISDTPYSAQALGVLVSVIVGEVILDKIYTSADSSSTKRSGALFGWVEDEERVAPSEWIHIGDDVRSDLAMPSARGVSAVRCSRSPAHLLMRRSVVGAVKIATSLSKTKPSLITNSLGDNKVDFGYYVLGPILAHICWSYWAFLCILYRVENTVAFFCARGGLLIRRCLEIFLKASRLNLEMPFRDFMVSRITALRLAMQVNASAAREELEREFSGASCADAALALSGLTIEGGNWSETFTYERFGALLKKDNGGQRVRDVIDEQAQLLRRHIDDLRGGKTNIVLCDTGLFGSTGRYLSIGSSDLQWCSAMIARAQYKSFSAAHFAFTAGLVSDAPRYQGWQPRSAMLRYWHLIESLFEPALPSVNAYQLNASGAVVSNLELAPGWTSGLRPGDLLESATLYLQNLRQNDLASIPERWLGLSEQVPGFG